MGGIACELANTIDVIDHAFELQSCRLGRGFAAHPAGHEHPGIERNADNSAAVNQRSKLFVAELPQVGHERPAILMTCPDRAGKAIERFLETLVIEMSHIENHSEPLDFLEQF